jgi:hypothetical protein
VTLVKTWTTSMHIARAGTYLYLEASAQEVDSGPLSALHAESVEPRIFSNTMNVVLAPPWPQHTDYTCRWTRTSPRVLSRYYCPPFERNGRQ